MIKTACIKPKKDNGICVRISVMSQHTLRDGKTPDLEITDDLFDAHCPEFGSPPKLIGAYLRKEIDWPEFERCYLEHIRQPGVMRDIEYFIRTARYMDIIFLCIEEDPQFCHRRLLAEECKRQDESVEIEIK